MSKPSRPFADRFWEKVVKGIGDECWRWIASKGPRGYGRLLEQPNKNILAHRASWIIHRGPIPDGFWVLHKCDNPECCNPDHLFLGTHLDNMADMRTKGRSAKPLRTHCKFGHQLEGNILIVRHLKTGKVDRRCRTCNNERLRLWRQREGNDCNRARALRRKAAIAAITSGLAEVLNSLDEDGVKTQS